jgi:2',3'-cyclic-nucleotide 2'-phosphodiesterase/3'-nucleotidase
VKITNRKSEVRKVSDKKPSVNKSLNTDFMGKWATIFAETASNEIGTIKSGELLENYFGLLEDSKAVELVNEAKISYALNFTQVTNTAYKTYPVIAATRYKSYGQEDSGGYVSLSGDISEAELSKLQAYNGYINLYTITGAQLREWLEWTASAYATGGISDNTSNEYLSGNTLLFEAWQNDWGGAYIFDGIEYKINTLLPARYSSGGTKISDSYRITSLTRNGVEIKDTDRFVLAVDRLTGVYDVIKDVTNQTISTGYNRSQTLVMNYLASCYKNIEISTQVDNNWSLLLNPSITYRLEGGDGSESVATTKSWYRQTVGTLSGYYYYDAVFNNVSTDTSGPLVVLRSLNQLTTNKDVSVAVQATDSSGVKKISYLKGKYTSTTDSDWSRATIITGSTFAATDNGIYSVMAEDEQGNRRIAYITIENINRGTLQVPSVETYTNRKTKIAGTAEAGATIYFEVGDEKYQTTVGTDGKFSYALPSQTAGTEIITYVKDGSGKSSSRLSLLVKRTGPNYPQVQTLANNETKISGSINDTNVKPVLLVGSTAYVASTDVELFQESEIYADKYSIVKSNVTIDASGNFSITIPAQRANTSIKLYTIDSAGRASRVYKSTVEEVAPNKPSLYAVTNIEKTVYGYVSGASESKPCDIEVYVGSDKYTGTTDATGYFTVETGTLKKGTTIRVYATDTGENGQTRRSAAGTTTVKDINNYVSEEGALTFNKITDKVTTLKGSYDVGNETLFLKIGSDYTTVTTNSSGNFTIDLEEPLDVGTNIYAVARYEKAGVAEAGKIQVTKGKPFQPTIKNKTVYNTTVTVSVESEENCTLYALLDGKTYSSGKYVSYDEETGMYLYKITIPKTNSGKKLSVYAKNSAGKSPVAETTIVEKAPNKPQVDTVTTTTTKITGSVHLILPLGTEDEEATVKNTGTKVYAKIGSKTYTAKVTDDGEFTIEIPKQKKGTKITVWGVNENGTGPKKSVTVK